MTGKTKGTTYELVVDVDLGEESNVETNMVDRVVASLEQVQEVDPVIDRAVEEQADVPLTPPEPEPEPLTISAPHHSKDPVDVPLGGILERRREERKLSAEAQRVQDLVDGVLAWGKAECNNKRREFVRTKLALELGTSVEVSGEVLDNLERAGLISTRKEHGGRVVDFRANRKQRT